jgi:transposase
LGVRRLRVRRAFGVEVGRLHADTTSFSVHGRYTLDLPEALETVETLKAAAQANQPVEDGADDQAPAVIEVTYGYSRDHREDLKQWMLALVTSGEGPCCLALLLGQKYHAAAGCVLSR